MNFPRLNDLLPRWDFFKPLRVALRNLATDGGDGVIVENTTPATEDDPVQKSPSIRLKGSAWKTVDEESAPVEIFIEAVPIESDAGAVALQLRAIVDGGDPIDLARVDSNGRVTLTNADENSPELRMVAFADGGFPNLVWLHAAKGDAPIGDPITDTKRIFQLRVSGQHDSATEPFSTTDNICFAIHVEATADWDGTDCPAILKIRGRSTIGTTLAELFTLTTDGDLALSGVNLTTGYSVRANRTTNQTIPNNTETVVAFTAERWDTNALHDNSTNNSRLKAVVAGTYQVSAHVCFVNDLTGIRYAFLRVNGSTVYTLQKVAVPGTGSLADWINLSTLIRMAANDYVEVIVFQNSGGDLDIASAGNHSADFAMTRVGA